MNSFMNAVNRRDELRRLSPAEAQARCQAAHAQAVRAWARECDETALFRLRCNKMLDEVSAWAPPTKEHLGLKEFMIQQLADTIEAYNYMEHLSYPSQMRWPDWLKAEIEKAVKDVSRADRNIHAAWGRTMQSNDWLRDLRRSLS